ncbi:MAG: glycosyltransferase [Patescibacteria group bacterium]
MKIALVQDFLTRLGGAERVLKVLADMYPKAPIYTLLYDEEKVGAVFPKQRVITSRLQNYSTFIRNRVKYLLPRIPQIVELWDFSGFDLVISSSTSFVHGIITGTKTRHVSYYHSPMRFAWDWHSEYVKEQNLTGLKKAAVAYIMKDIREWDRFAGDRPDFHIANSETVRKRIKKYYRIDAGKVIHPPVDISRFSVGKSHEDYFLIVSTLTPYKRIELAIQLFNKIGRRLVIIGDGPHKNFLQTISKPNIEFLGFKSDEAVAEYMKNCRALIFPGEDDFGITPVEAMACGKPVIAYGHGGATETIIAGKTGEFFHEPTVTSLEQGLARFFNNERSYSPLAIRRHANQFSEEVFKKKILEVIKS